MTPSYSHAWFGRQYEHAVHDELWEQRNRNRINETTFVHHAPYDIINHTPFTGIGAEPPPPPTTTHRMTAGEILEIPGAAKDLHFTKSMTSPLRASGPLSPLVKVPKSPKSHVDLLTSGQIGSGVLKEFEFVASSPKKLQPHEHHLPSYLKKIRLAPMEHAGIVPVALRPHSAAAVVGNVALGAHIKTGFASPVYG